MTEDYELSISLNTLTHLGDNLYKNIPKAVSEAVANSWDAEATEVKIRLRNNQEEVVVQDNGIGMSRYDINNKLLKIGYQKRDPDNEGDTSDNLDREYMGRKGIGKLALFSLADELKVFTKKEGEDPQALRIDVEKIEEMISEDNPDIERTYNPDDISEEFDDNFPDNYDTGTVFVLGDLDKNVNQNTLKGLRQRLARRFAVLNKDDFDLYVDNNRVTVKDKNYFHKSDYMWFIGSPGLMDEGYYREEAEADSHKDGTTPGGREVHGWIASANKPSDLEVDMPDNDTEAEDVNKIHLIVRGKMGKEDLLEITSTSKIITNYLFGEIYADWMDDTGEDDIHATDREEFDKDAERTKDLEKFLDNLINEMREEWDNYREERKMEDVKKTEAWKEEISKRSPEEKQVAKSFLKDFAGKEDVTHDQMERLADFAIENLEYQSFIKLQDELLEEEVEDPDTLIQLFGKLEIFDALETMRVSLGRMIAIVKFQEMIENEAKEMPDLQEHLAENPFLLDPSWDYKDQRVTRSQAFEDYEDDETNTEVDILALEWGRTMIIVELKRPGRAVGIDEFQQLQGYVTDYQSRKSNYSYESVKGVLVGNNFQDNAINAVENTDNIEKRSLHEIKRETERKYGHIAEIFKNKADKKEDRRLKKGLLRFQETAEKLGLDIETEINDYDGREE